MKSKIRTIPDFPKQGIMFRDLTTLLSDPEGLAAVVTSFVDKLSGMDVDFIAGIESRGFIIAGCLGAVMNKGIVLIRKPGKLPGKTAACSYELEYGTDTLEIHEDAFPEDANIVLVDDLVATGGTMEAACKLIEKIGGKIVQILFIIDLPDLKGTEKIKDYPCYWLTEFEGE
ncbi:adenine phosphoribosyltransferase [Planctomycetota bacterium]